MSTTSTYPARAKMLVLTIASAALLALLLPAIVSAQATLNVHSADLSTTVSTAEDANASATLDAGVVTLVAEKFSTVDWSASEARITIDPSDVGVATLGDLETMTWDTEVVAGYIPHLDVILDVDGDGVYDSETDDALVFEAAKVDPNVCETSESYPTGSQDTLGRGTINDGAYAWLNSGNPGPGCVLSVEDGFYTHTLTDWKTGPDASEANGKTINGNTAVLRFELEVDPWISDSEAQVSNIVINDTPYYLSIQNAVEAAVEGDTVEVAAGTYDESVLIDNQLTLKSAGAVKSVITGSGSGQNYIIKIDGANDVILNGLEINGEGTETGDNTFDYGIWVSGTDNVEIMNSDIKNVWKDQGNGIQVDDSTNSDIHDNTISLFQKRGIRYINSDGALHDNEIIGDNVDGTNRVQNLVNVFDGSNVEVYSNDLHNALTNPEDTPTWDSPGIFVSSYAWDGSEADSYANIHDNEIYDSDSGIVVGSVYSIDTDESSADIIDNNLHNLKWAINFEVNTVSATITGNSFTDNEIAVNAEGQEPIDGPAVNAENNYWGAASGPSGEGAGDGGKITAVNVDFRPWLLEEGGTHYDQTVALIESGEWSLVSAPQTLTSQPTVLDDEGSAVALLGYENGAFGIPTDNNKPVSAFYAKPTNKGGVGFSYADVDPSLETKELQTGWNLVGVGTENTPTNAFSTIKKDNDNGNGVTTLNVPTDYNARKDLGGVWGGGAGNIDISNWAESMMLNIYDGFWVHSNAPKTYSLVQ